MRSPLAGMLRGSAAAVREKTSAIGSSVMNRNAPLRNAEKERLQRIIQKVTLYRIELIIRGEKSDQKPMLS